MAGCWVSQKVSTPVVTCDRPEQAVTSEGVEGDAQHIPICSSLELLSVSLSLSLSLEGTRTEHLGRPCSMPHSVEIVALDTSI